MFRPHVTSEVATDKPKSVSFTLKGWFSWFTSIPIIGLQVRGNDTKFLQSVKGSQQLQKQRRKWRRLKIPLARVEAFTDPEEIRCRSLNI